MKPGFCIGGENFIADAEGYRALDGYERFDGRPAPSEASYSILRFDAGTAAISDGDTVTGATSGATGVALQDAVVETGAYGTSDAAGYLVLGEVSGEFDDDENLQVSAATKCVANGSDLPRGASTPADDLTFLGLARSNRRAVIARPNGSAAIRGLFSLNGDAYALVGSSGVLAIYKATSSGWTAVTPTTGYIRFTVGSGPEPQIGDTLTDGTFNAVLVAVVVQSGSFSGGDAIGYFVTATSPALGSSLSWSGGTGTASSSGSLYTSRMSASGTGNVEAVAHSFGGLIDQKAYLTGLEPAVGSGVECGWEFDGTDLVPLFCGFVPTRVGVFSGHLFYGAGGRVVHSGIGAPRDWRTAAGAGEFALGADLTNIAGASNTALILTGVNMLGYLTGTSAADFDLKVISSKRGAYASSLLMVNGPYYFDETGLRRLTADDTFGGFSMSGEAPQVDPIFRSFRRNGNVPVGAYRVQRNDQFRVLYGSNLGLSFYIGRRAVEVMPIKYPFQAAVVAECPDVSGFGDVVLCGTADGWVFAMDRGTSFDGAEFTCWFRLSHDPVGHPRREKRFHECWIESRSTDQVEYAMSFVIDYGRSDDASVGEQTDTTDPTGGIWNDDIWESFAWSAPEVSAGEFSIQRVGAVVSVGVAATIKEERTASIDTITINYTGRKLKRGI